MLPPDLTQHVLIKSAQVVTVALVVVISLRVLMKSMLVIFDYNVYSLYFQRFDYVTVFM